MMSNQRKGNGGVGADDGAATGITEILFQNGRRDYVITTETADEITDDPLAAAIEPPNRKIYAVSRVNPLFNETTSNVDDDEAVKEATTHELVGDRTRSYSRQSTPLCCEKSNSSGYGGSNSQEPIYIDNDYNHKNDDKRRQTRKHEQSPTTTTTTANFCNLLNGLTTIPEGKIDLTTTVVPRPIWPRKRTNNDEDDDSLINDATSLRHLPNERETIKDVLIDLLRNVNDVIDGKSILTQEELLRNVNERINFTLNVLRHSVEDDMRKLSMNLINDKKMNSVVKALTCQKVNVNETVKSVNGDFDYENDLTRTVFVHDDLSNVKNGVRNAVMYGTLCRNKQLNRVDVEANVKQKKNLLTARDDGKPSVWEQYYGVKVIVDIDDNGHVPKPTDVPLYVSVKFRYNRFPIKQVPTVENFKVTQLC